MVTMPITPETKNWTWVLERACPDCGFDAVAVPGAAVPELVRENVMEWAPVLEAPGARIRPDDSTWSPLEYAAHVRDVLAIARVRVALMLAESDPLFANWDQDATAVAERYEESDPVVVESQVRAEGEGLAAELDALPPEAWDRTGRRSDGARFTVDSFARYVLHDVEHHVWDVRPPAGGRSVG